MCDRNVCVLSFVFCVQLLYLHVVYKSIFPIIYKFITNNCHLDHLPPHTYKRVENQFRCCVFYILINTTFFPLIILFNRYT